MRIKVVGLGQCGSFVVYDVLAHLFDGKPSKELRSASNQPDFQAQLESAFNRIKRPIATVSYRISRYFLGFKTADLPTFFVVDGNSNNAMIAGLTRDNTDKLDELDISVNSLSLYDRNTGCSYGQVGEYYFRKEERTNSSIYGEIKFNDADNTDINVVVFSGGGGSGSGGAIVLNEQAKEKNPRDKSPLLFNMIVLPPYNVSEFRQRFNTGRCITRLSTSQRQTSLLLFSNLSDDLNDQYAVNKYIRETIIRLANMGFPGNVPKWGTDVDIADLKSFFMGKPAFLGISSSTKADQANNRELVEDVIKRALRSRKKADTEGLSIEMFDGQEEEAFKGIRKVLAVIGVPSSIDATEVDAPSIVRREIAQRMGRLLSDIDIAVFSYGSLSEVEITIFFRYNKYSHCHLFSRFFDNGFFRWYKNEETELQYMTQPEDDDADNTELADIYNFVREEMRVSDPHMDSSAIQTLEYRLVRPS